MENPRKSDVFTAFGASKTELENALNLAATQALKGPVTGGNPRVGCVILRDGQVLATGYHRGAGTAHAEAAALAYCRENNIDTAGATAIVTLEPCNHQGRTPACSRALIDAKIAAVIYAAADPNPTATGGAQTLQQAGIKVATARQLGLDKQVVARAQAITSQWRMVMERGLPWVIAKTAASLDGKIAAADGTSKWITGPQARAHSHRHLRATVDAIIIGTGTAIADNPALTYRAEPDQIQTETGPQNGAESLGNQPIPVVIGNRDLPENLQIKQRKHLHFKTHNLQEVLRQLFTQGCRRVLIEGGAGLVSAALKADLVDEWWYYLAPLALGEGKAAVSQLGVDTLAKARRWQITETTKIGADLHIRLEKPLQTKEEPCSQD